METTSNMHPSPGLHTLAIAMAACTLLLIFIGGTVTSNDAGLAVPDWPTTFGQNMFAYPPSKWVGGVLFEHGHRLAGSGVGLLMIVLAVWTQVRARRSWVCVFAWAMLGGVILQGILGGIRVTEKSIALAIVHGCVGQLFFCMTVCMILFTSRAWLNIDERNEPAAGSVRWVCAVASTLVFLQLIAGALYRHTGAGLAYHVAGAMIVTLAVGAVVMGVTGGKMKEKLLMRQVAILGALLLLQLLLGLVAYLLVTRMQPGQPATFWAWFIPSAHVAVGAAILGVSVGLTVSAWKIEGERTVTVTRNAFAANVVDNNVAWAPPTKFSNTRVSKRIVTIP